MNVFNHFIIIIIISNYKNAYPDDDSLIEN